MAAIAFMCMVLIGAYLAMVALVLFAEHVIEKPRLTKRHESIGKAVENAASR